MTTKKNEEFFKKPNADQSIIEMNGEGPNFLSSFENLREGETPYYNNWMNLTHVEYWDSAPGDTGTSGERVSDYMTQIWKRLKFENGSKFLELGGPFNGYRIETWNLNRAMRTPDNIDGGIDKSAGLTWSFKLTRINSKYCKTGGIYSHEFGHNYHFCCDIMDNSRTRIGSILGSEYNRIRGIDFTIRTSKYQRFAEDFKYFFGADDVAKIDDLDDDAMFPSLPDVGKQVRWARQVPGLKSFIQGAWPVFNWLKDKDIVNFNYIDADSWFKWERKTSWVTSQWEAFSGGVFYRWDGSKWVVYN